MGEFISISIAVFLIVILLLVAILLVAKKYLSPSGRVTITINGDQRLVVDQGSSLLTTLNNNGCHLLVVARVVAVNAVVRLLKAVAKFWTQKKAISAEKR